MIVFLGGLYVAIHSRIMPTWASTSIWYVGVSSLFVALTIVIEWIAGTHHSLSYNMLGHFGEAVMNINLAILVLLMFFYTVFQDMKYKRKRERREDDQRVSL